ncbi:hypothetical protein GQ53DRAFT_15027 [Thozetella sp. PMI_491]|nr:hypothetical protein GQ53DRAFT_15027 [Thozetella sp. PMI_491]
MYQNTPSETDRYEPSVEYTRNGRLQACRPCKVSKLRCDHKEPCIRCVKRNIPSQCIYSSGGRSKVRIHFPDLRTCHPESRRTVLLS